MSKFAGTDDLTTFPVEPDRAGQALANGGMPDTAHGVGELFDPNILLPSQQGQQYPHDPIKKGAAMVIAQAMLDINNTARNGTDPVGIEAMLWVMAPGDHELGFEWWCERGGLDPNFIRERLTKHLGPGGACDLNSGRYNGWQRRRQNELVKRQARLQAWHEAKARDKRLAKAVNE